MNDLRDALESSGGKVLPEKEQPDDLGSRDDLEHEVKLGMALALILADDLARME